MSNDSIPFLLPFRRLEQLDIPETAVTSQGIEKLAPLIWLNQIAAPDGVMTVEAAERFRKSRLAAIEAAKMAGSEVPPVDWVPYSVTEGMPHERDSTTSDLVDLQNLMARSAQRAGQVELKLNGWTGELISPTSIGFSEDSEDGISSRQFAWKYVKGAEQMAQFVLTFGHYAGVMGSLPILSEMNREAYPQYRNFGDESRMTLRVGKLNAKIDRVPAERLYSASHAENILFHSTFSVDGIWDADLENSFVRTYLNAPGGNRQERATTLLYRVHMITDRHVSVDAQHEILSEFLACADAA